ncbi:hypothetical protein QM012_000738 [Aureobasidium pullulans]|uniref:F-box domain-containing protein n=1 Tax=Aureobasidium pullulans TaxID=5580 RepID=A0ABR0TWJ3_AURPU
MTHNSNLSPEIRLMVYKHLPLEQRFVFDLKACQESDEPIEEAHPESAGLFDLIHGFKNFARFRYLMQFSAIVERGGEGDIVDFDVDENPDLEYFACNKITHFGSFICDYEKGAIHNDNEAVFARGKIEVSVDYHGNTTVTGDADCDNDIYDETDWDWFRAFRTEIVAWLEAEIEDLRERSGDDEESESEAQDEEDEGEESSGVDEDEIKHIEGDSDEEESDQSSRTRRIDFLDLPPEVKNLIYFYLYRDRTKRAINICVFSPAWKSPSPPTALMNTCSTIASGSMPLYFSNCLFTIDKTYKVNSHLLEQAFEWLKRVGDKSSAHFRRLHVVYIYHEPCNNEIMLSITAANKVVLEEIRGPAEYLARDKLLPPRERLLQSDIAELFSRLATDLTEDLIKTLTQRITTNKTGAMGVAEFEIILNRIEFHMTWFRKGWEELMVKREMQRRRHCGSRRRQRR